MDMLFCSSAIETTFPLFNFKTKHIFGILITLWKLIKLWGAAGAPNILALLPPPQAPLPRSAREILLKAGVSQVYT